jgi:hypothetical protein
MSSGRSSSLIVRSDAIMALIVLYGTREIGFRPGIFGLAVSVGGFGAVIGSINLCSAAWSLAWARSIRHLRLWSHFVGIVLFSIGQPGGQSGNLFFDRYLLCVECGGRRGDCVRLDDPPVDYPKRSPRKDEWSFSILRHRHHAFGALFGGWLGSVIGIRSTLVVGAIGLLLSCITASFSHLMRLKALPAASL